MDIKNRALQYFREGYNCAQSVAYACAGTDAPAARAAAAFGGGMGRMQKTCGAVTGAYIYLGLAFGKDGIPAEEDKINLYAKVQQFNRLFIERNGTDQCSELLGEDLNTPEGKSRIKEKDLHARVCEKCISDAIDILSSLQ